MSMCAVLLVCLESSLIPSPTTKDGWERGEGEVICCLWRNAGTEGRFTLEHSQASYSSLGIWTTFFLTIWCERERERERETERGREQWRGWETEGKGEGGRKRGRETDSVQDRDKVREGARETEREAETQRG